MAADPPFIDIHAFLDDLLVDDHSPTMFGSIPYPHLHQSFPLDHLLLDPTSQNLTFPSNGLAPLVDVTLVSKVEAEGLCFPTQLGISIGNSLSPGAESSSPLSDGSNDSSSEAVLKYINQILMEEDIEETPWFFSHQDALHTTEKSLYDALGQGLPDQSLDVGHMLDSLSGDGLIRCADGTRMSSSDSVDPDFVHSAVEFDLDAAMLSAGSFRGGIVQKNVGVSPHWLAGGVGNDGGLSRSDTAELSVTNIFGGRDSMEQFRKGLEEASKFLPSSAELFKNIDNLNFVGNASPVASVYGSKAFKTHIRDDLSIEEGRSKKQTATSGDEVELSDIFDEVLLCAPRECSDDNLKEADLIKNSQPQGRRQKGGKSHGKKQKDRKTVDLSDLLVLCAQSVSGHNLRTANELLKQIRENSSPLGDSSQRLAHYFGNALDARMAGNGGQVASFFTSPTFKKMSAADMLKAFHAHLTACPFLKFSIFFGGYMIHERAANAKALHIIDFGIGFGFHWPVLIQRLSERPGGPPRLRMTGIEFPVPGFRPAQRIEDTFRRLAKYCERFGVPFEYAAIPSADWSSIRIEDLKLRSDEMIAVSSINRLKNLLDETVEDRSPRDAVLDLIRRINPEIFVHSTVVGSYTAPFFVTRFREVLFHMSAMFDIFEATMGGESAEREVIERELLGREIMNVVACEGSERIDRAETHKQWEVRIMRAGLKAMDLDVELVGKLRRRLRQWYHKDFVVDEDKNWMLLGWRGRIINSSSCWVPC